MLTALLFHIIRLKIEISSKQDVIIDIDGEEGSLLPVTIQVIHKAINILIP